MKRTIFEFRATFLLVPFSLYNFRLLLSKAKNNCGMFLYPDSFVLLGDFHREQAWERWLNKQGNGCSEVKQDVLAKLRRIARATTENACQQAITELKESSLWKDPLYAKLVEYVDRYWLKEKKVG